MNFTIERAAFLTAAKRAAQLAPSASPLEVLKCALLEIDTGMRSLHMTATNMEVMLRQDVPLLAYEGGDTTFAIDAKLLSAMHQCQKLIDLCRRSIEEQEDVI